MPDPYYFPFEKINKNELIPGDKYYIKLNDAIIKKFVDMRRNIPVSHLEGFFVRLHTENDGINSIEYAVFKKVKILNRIYRPGLCNMMVVRNPEGFLATAGGCNTYSDLNRTINEDREVYFAINKWMFGKPTEHKLLTKQVVNSLINPLGQDNIITTKELLGEKIEKPEKKEIGGRKKRKTKINKRNKSNKSRTRRRRR